MRISRALWLALAGLVAVPWASDGQAQPAAVETSDSACGAPDGSGAQSRAGTAPHKAGSAAPQGSRAKQASKKSGGKRSPSKSAKRGKRSKSAAQPKRTKRSRRKPRPRKPGSKPGTPDDAARRQLTANYTTPRPSESAELQAMRALDHQLFPESRATPRGAPWATTLPPARGGPRVDASGLPVAGAGSTPGSALPAKDLSWLSTLKLPDIPVRWEPAVVRYLEYYKDHPKGRRMVARWIRKSGRYRQAIVRLLRQYRMPDDVLWLALVESAFNPAAFSWAGAAGLWQFMPATGRIYGLTVNRRIDERLDPERSTHAALRHLKDLHQRFGSWELAFAAYNMGYGGVLSSIRKYNTNDYWELRKLEAALPYETALYVPKIVAIAVVAKNCGVFGCDGVELDEPSPFEPVAIGPGVTLNAIAEAAGASADEIARLNPHLRGSRTPPLEQSPSSRDSWTAYVPRGKAAQVAKKLPVRSRRRRSWTTHRVRWGESVARMAELFGTTERAIERLNDLHRWETPRPGTVIFMPRGSSPKPRNASGRSKSRRREVTIADHDLQYSGQRRVFYEVLQGDSIPDVARVCAVSPKQIVRWNHLDPGAALQGGMMLQLFIPDDARPDDVVLHEEDDVRMLTVGTDAFYAHFEGLKGRQRLELTVTKNDSWKKLSKRYGLSLGMLERINHRSRNSTLRPGQKIVVYARKPPPKTTTGDAAPGCERSAGHRSTTPPPTSTAGLAVPGATIAGGPSSSPATASTAAPGTAAAGHGRAPSAARQAR